MLTPQDEARAVIEVTERLALSFPEVNAADVERAVRRSYEQFTGSPIRDFVPLLVERMTREGLNENRAGLLSASRI